MSIQHNDSLSLDWLMPLFAEQFAELSAHWQGYQDGKLSAIVSDMAQHYHQIGGALTMVNLPLLADLSEALSALTLHISNYHNAHDIGENETNNQQLNEDMKSLTNLAFQSHELLSSELEELSVSGSFHQQLVAASSDDIVRILLPDAEMVVNEFSELSKLNGSNEQLSTLIELPPIAKEKLNLSLEQRQKIKQAWKFHQEKLLESDSNESQSVKQIYKMSQFVWRGCVDTLEQRAWYLACLWLGCVSKNSIPKPQQYGRVLEKLNSLLPDSLQLNRSEMCVERELSSAEEEMCEAIIAELFIQIKLLKNIDEETKKVVNNLYTERSDSDEFFARILKKLEQIIFQLHEPKTVIQPLVAIKQQLDRRGWGVYVTYLELILADLEIGAGSTDIYVQVQWQVERQLQELYGSIFAMKQNIGEMSEVTESSEVGSNLSNASQMLRKVRISIETIKTDFNQYISSHSLDNLPKVDEFERIHQNLVEMEIDQATEVLDKLASLFNRYHENTLTQVNWTIIGATADSIAEFELFLDYLARQVLDVDRLEKASERIDQANAQIDNFIAGPQSIFDDVEKLVDDTVMRYGDTGEIAPDYEVSGEHKLANETLSNDKNNIDAFDILNKPDDLDTAVDSVIDEAKFDKPIGESTALQEARASLPEDSFDMDEDIQEIFIEEAEEVLELMDENLPVWASDPEDFNTLKEIRRGFHTLKGSGRMVGANNAGEMSWSVENILNRVLDNTLPVTDELVSFITDTKNKIPILVEDYTKKQAPTIDPAITLLKAKNLLAGKDINEGIPAVRYSVVSQSGIEEEMIEYDTVENSDALVINTTVINEEQEEKSAEREKLFSEEFVIPSVLQSYWDEAQELPTDTGDADEDIKEIFIEEAEEVLEVITPLFDEWCDVTDDAEMLTDLRRGFHTLKGSGRMVGANHTAELAWSIENMLNRVLERTVEVKLGLISLVKDVLKAYPKLVQTYADGTNDYPEIMSLWVASANGYSKNLGDEFDYRELLQAYHADRAEESNHLGVISPVIEDVDSSEAKEQISDEEREFIDIFIEEAKERLAVIQDFVTVNKDTKEVEVSDEVVRAFHTLRGASNAESLHTISKVSHSIEDKLSQLQQNEALMTAQHLDAVAKASTLIDQQLSAFESSTGNEISEESEQELHVIQSLLNDNDINNQNSINTMTVEILVDEEVDELLDAEWDLQDKLNNAHESQDYANLMALQIEILQERTQTSKKFQSLLAPMQAIYQQVIENPEMAGNNTVQENLLAGHQQLSELFDSLASGMALKLDDQVITDLNDISGMEFDDETIKREIDNSKKEQVPVDVPVKEDAHVAIKTLVEYEEIHTDPDLLEIFLEEAKELDTEIVTIFSRWRQDSRDMDALKELQRYLHTIKGGARMAGISSIGDLTHEMETIYEGFVNQNRTPSEPWLNVMQTAQDALSMQIEEVSDNQRSFLATAMIEELLAFAKIDKLPYDAHLTMPVLEHKQEEIEVVEEENEQLDEISISFQEMVENSWEGEQPDPDILEVFLEEADELIESSSQNLQQFRSNTGALSYLQALQRELHTVKGGARMVGTNSIADLAHEMETVYEELGARRLPATRMVLELLASCHDWVANSIHLLKNNINPPMPMVMIDALKAFHRNPGSLKELPIFSLKSYTDAIDNYESYLRSLKGDHDTSDMPPMLGSFGEFSDKTDMSNEQIRVSSGVMERMINLSGESAINRARIDMGMTSLSNSIEEMGTTVQRLADQLRRMEIELEVQVMAQIDDAELLENEDFDPLEMDQYSSLNQLSKSLSESASDLLEIKSTLLEKTRDSENLLMQLSRTQAELQEGLMSSRIVPFSRLTPRLQRIVRQTANEISKEVELNIGNADDEMDRTILERITSPLEHMLRNAVDHGIEPANERERMGKDRMGRIDLSILREGGEMVIHLSDDGSGIDVEQVRQKAISQGLIDPKDNTLTDTDIMQYIFNAGLSTTKKITQISGRGVGMDVVRSEIRQLGGTVAVESTKGKGSRFTMRVPLTVAVSDALIVRAADRHYVIPLVQIERVEQINPEELYEYYKSDRHTFNIQNQAYRLRYLNEILTGNTLNDLASSNNTLPVIVIKNQTGQSLALQVDEIIGSRIEVVIKPLGKQLSHLSGVSAATIMGDGSVVLILDMMALVRNAPVRQVTATVATKPSMDVRKKILVIDDSVTVRKVTSRFLERQGFDAHVAKDGVDALEILQEFTPDLMLLDIEMPRMDGFEVATQVRNTVRLRETPIIMITSRTGDKHRERAMEIGVNDYLGKPFQEDVLLDRIDKLLGMSNPIQRD